jgi:dienelactone hydrolase
MLKEDKDNLGEIERSVRIPIGEATLEGDLAVPEGASGIVIFAHGGGSSRQSPRNRGVARVIREAGVGALLFDLLTREEEAVDLYTRHLRFDIEMLTERLIRVTDWLAEQREARNWRVGYFGASTGAAATLIAAARLGEKIGAVVSRGGRPDLAGHALPLVKSPTLLIVGGHDQPVIELNRRAYELMRCKKEMRIIPGATHLFEEPGALEQVAELAAAWFRDHLQAQALRAAGAAT